MLARYSPDWGDFALFAYRDGGKPKNRNKINNDYTMYR